ncbi:MAG TPA: alpha-amylase family glycosyl hydrolase [Balneolaceae bacterium]
MKKVSLILLTLFCVPVFWNPVQSQDLQKPPVVGFATPFQLQPGTDTLYVQDYVIDVSTVDRIEAPNVLQASLTEDHRFIIAKGILQQPVADLALWVNGESYHIPLQKSRKKTVTVTFEPQHSYKQVLVKGQMNNWNAASGPMKLENGTWSIDFQLKPGTYEYLFVVDGKEILDPFNDHIVSNGMGGQNSVLTVTGPAESEFPSIQTASYTSSKIKVKADQSTGVLVYWQNKLIDAELGDEWLAITIPEQAKELDRSFLRVWTYNDIGASNDLLIPLEKGRVVHSVDQLNRDDWERTVMYFIMVDRFNNGNPTNDEPVQDPDILPEANYYGGDLAGITQKIKDGYFERLGINALWLSPITQNPKGAYGLFPDPETQFSGYHGYWPISSSEVDYRFGSEESLRELLQTAHANGMNVILDYVANHVHELHPVYQKHPEWANPLYLPDGSMNTGNWDTYRLTTWFDTFMPDLDFSKPVVVETMTDSAVYWLQHYSFDGFRHDATKHVPLPFWRRLTQKLKSDVVIPENDRIYQIGETYGSRALIASYINTGMIDGQFDFNVYDDAVAVFARDDEPMSRLSNSLQASFDYYGYHNLMGYITGNHDRARFISYAGGALSFEEDAKVAGWTRHIGVGDPVGYKKLAMLMAFNMTIPGIPIIYYGDEIGMPGGGDPDNRHMMRFKDLKPRELKMRRTTSHLTELRSNRLSLIYGDFHHLLVTKKQYAYARNYFDEWTIVFFNKSDNEKTITVEMPEGFSVKSLEAQFGSVFQHNGKKIEVTLAPYSFEILTTPKLKSNF